MSLIVRVLRRTNDGDVEPVGAVIWFGGAIHIVGNGDGDAEGIRRRLVDYQVGGEDGVLEPSAGEPYVRGICETLRGSRYWATAAEAIADDEAARLARSATLRL